MPRTFRFECELLLSGSPPWKKLKVCGFFTLAVLLRLRINVIAVRKTVIRIIILMIAIRKLFFIFGSKL